MLAPQFHVLHCQCNTVVDATDTTVNLQICFLNLFLKILLGAGLLSVNNMSGMQATHHMIDDWNLMMWEAVSMGCASIR
eukprot:m.320395 g.320395  ORF g.320395 m.320395 type:complete len:79 (+) comp20318_c0_seq2:75-311(+)